MPEVSWRDQVSQALSNLGGVATLHDLYDEIERHPLRELRGDWQSTVRQTLYDHSRDSASYRTGMNLFRRLGPGERSGRWELLSPEAMQTMQTTIDQETDQAEKNGDFDPTDNCNGILWERFAAKHQAEEIERAWPGVEYEPKG